MILYAVCCMAQGAGVELDNPGVRLCGFWRELGVVLYALVRALCADGRIRLHDRSLDRGVVGWPASELGHRTRHRRDHNLLERK